MTTITPTAAQADLLATWANAIPFTTIARDAEHKLAFFGLVPTRDENGEPALRSSPRITIPACRCSERQLEQVGCDCEHEDAIRSPDDRVSRKAMLDETADELRTIAEDGAQAAFDRKAERSCPFYEDSAQGIIWTQAFRLTADRLSDFATEVGQ
jgi:hypothetical protein